MADLRIVDAPEIPTENITGEEKLPTGGSGNYSITLDSVADYTKTKKDLADNTSVDTKVNGVRQELDAHIEDLLNPHQVTKGQIGLGNVDNTADADKPVSNSTQAAIISAVAQKADKTYVDNQLTLKANKTDVYTKQESSDLVNNSISTALTPVNSSLDLAKRGVINRYDPLLTYNSWERVVVANGDILKSTIDGNTNDPNVNMTGWVLDQNSNYGTPRAKNRSVQSKLKDIPSILDWDADSANDDSARIQKALLDGVDSLFIPPKSSYGVFKVGELELTKSIKLWGVGGQGIDQQSSVIQKVAGATYALHFNGLGQTSRPLGGGLEDVMIYGVAAEEADLIRVTRWSYFKALNTAFQNSKGWGLKLKNVMESTFSTNNFRRLGSESTGIILFDDYIDIGSENCNNIHICGSTFALSSGDWIKSTDSSNPDLIWINNNKFEYDGTPSGNENVNPKSVIHFGQMARSFIKDNGFTHFTNSHNKYDQIITMGSGCSGYGVEFKDNNILDCDKAYTINGGRFIARDNEAVNLIADGVITSNIGCDVDAIIRKTTNGNIVSVKQTKLDPTFIPASRLGGTISRLFVADADSSSGQALTLTNTVGDNEIRRLTIPNYLINSGRVIKFTARVKNTSAIAATLKLVIDGSFTNPYSLNNSAVITASVSASSDYTNYSWYITPNNIGAGSLRLYSGGDGAILNFDGVFVDFAKYVDYSYTWNITSVAPTTLAASSPQGLVFKDYIESVSAPSFDSAILDLIPSVSTYNSTNSFRATLFNPANTAVSIAVTRVRVRVNLK